MKRRVWITWWIIFCIRYSRLFWVYLTTHETVTDNPSIMIYINKTDNNITFKIKTWHYFEILTPETMKLHGSTKSKINKDKMREKVPRLEMNEVVLIHYNVVSHNYEQESRILYAFVTNKSFGGLLDISSRNLYF